MLVTLNPNSLFILLVVFSLLVGSSHDSQAATTYRKDQLSFKLPTGWVAKEDYMAPGSRRSIGVDTTGASLILMEIYFKPQWEYAAHAKKDTSSLLEQYAARFKKFDIVAKLQPKQQQPWIQSKVQRKGHEGLRETQKFVITDLIDENSIREFYRIDVKDEIVFITMDTAEDEYKQTAAGLEVILGSFKYLGPK